MYLKSSVLSIFIIIVILTSCNIQERKDESILRRSETILEQNPDSVFQLLTVEIHPGELNEDLYAQYSLLLIQAKYKMNKNIVNDTVIFKIKDHYVNKRNYEKAALASLYSGHIFSLKNKKEEAMNMYLEAEEYLKDSDNFALRGLIRYFMGDLYFNQFLKDEAIEKYKQAAAYFNKSEKYKNALIAYEKIGITFLMKEEIDSCFHYYNKGMALSENHNDSIEQAKMVRNMGLAFNQTGNYEQARLYLRRSIPYFNDSIDKAKAYLNMAYSFNDGKNKDSTLYYIDKSLELINDRNYDLKQAIYQLLARIEERDKNYDQALSYHKEYTKYLFGMVKETNNQAILDVQKKYDFELVQNENNRLLIEKQSASLIILGLITIILIIILYYFRKNVKNKTALADAEQKISQLTDMADSFDEKEDSFRKILFQHFDILKKVALIETHLKEEEKKQGQKLLKKVNEIIYNEGTVDWNLIIRTMDQLYKGFPTTLLNTYPQLDDSEFKICCLTYAGLNNTEISIIMALSINTIQMKKSNIRKKLGIDGYGNIVEFLSKQLGC